MGSIDLLVISVLASVALYPAAVQWITAALGKMRRQPAPSPDALPWPEPDDVDGWRQRWTGVLIALLGELENRPDGLPSEPSETLCRELMWEIIGGGSNDGKQVKK